jgi:hypothetical protein
MGRWFRMRSFLRTMVGRPKTRAEGSFVLLAFGSTESQIQGSFAALRMTSFWPG